MMFMILVSFVDGVLNGGNIFESRYFNEVFIVVFILCGFVIVVNFVIFVVIGKCFVVIY